MSDFHSLRAALSWKPDRVIFFAFDLLHLDGRDFRQLPLLDRREHLAELLSSADQALQFSEAIE